MIYSFHKYLRRAPLLSEGWFSTVVSWVKQKLQQLFSRLGFGETIEMKIPTQLSEGADIRAFIGYYAETVTAKVLAEQIQSAGGRLANTATVEIFKRLSAERLKKAKNAAAPATEITRANEAGRALGVQIWKDIAEQATDFPALTFDIILSGDSEKGKSKADLILRVTKDSNQKVLATIAASLKVYKTASINLANTSFISLIKKLFYDPADPIHARTVTTEEFIERFVEDYGEEMRPALKKLVSYQQLIARKTSQGVSKSEARRLAKLSHPQVIDLIVTIFSQHYRGRNKAKINARFLKLLGFDEAEDFYAAIGTRGTPRVISSRQSEEFKALLAAFQSSITISMERNKNTNNIRVVVTDAHGTELLHGTITFADSGGTTAAGKTNFFVDFSRFLS